MLVLASVLLVSLFAGWVFVLHYGRKHGWTTPVRQPFRGTGKIRDPTPVDSYAVRLALTYPSWVNRRVERFDFVDATTVRRHMSIDFELPDARLGDEPEEPGGVMALVPLMLLKKGMLRGLDVTDADGCSLNVLGSGASIEVALTGLQDMIERLTGSVLPEAPVRRLEEILRQRPIPAEAAAKAALRPGGELAGWLASLPTLPIDADAEDRKELVENLRALIEELASGFLLLVAVPYRPDSPSLIKVSYDARIETSVRQFYFDRGLLAASRLFLNRLFSSLGWVGRVEYFTGLAVRRGESYHAEIVPASGTYCEEANLCVRQGGTKEEPVPTKGVYRDFHHSRPHLWIGGGGDETGRDEEGLVEVVVYAGRDGLILPLLFSASVIAGILAIIPGHHEKVDGITLGALLLAPIALAAFYARSDENGYLTMAMRGVRLAGLITVIAAITVIALLALGYIHTPDGNGSIDVTGNAVAVKVMTWAARVSLGCAVALFLAMCAPAVNEFSRWLWLDVKTAPLPRGKWAGVPDLRVMLLPPLILLTFGVAITGLLLSWLPI